MNINGRKYQAASFHNLEGNTMTRFVALAKGRRTVIEADTLELARTKAQQIFKLKSRYDAVVMREDKARDAAPTITLEVKGGD